MKTWIINKYKAGPSQALLSGIFKPLFLLIASLFLPLTVSASQGSQGSQGYQGSKPSQSDQANDKPCIRAYSLPNTEKIIQIVKTAVTAKGRCIEFLNVSSARATALMRSGQIQVDLVRVLNYKNVIKNDALPLQQPWLETKLQVICQKSIPCTLKSLKNRTVGIHYKSSWSKPYRKGFSKIVNVQDTEKLVSLFTRKRIEAMMMASGFIDYTDITLPSDIKIVTLQTVPVHIFIQKDAQHLMPFFNDLIPTLRTETAKLLQKPKQP